LLKDKQEDLDGKLDVMKKENEALWREVVSLRQKHQSQQKIVNKLIQFLVSMVQPRMGAHGAAAVKRRYQSQLAIEDAFDAPPGKTKKPITDIDSDFLSCYNFSIILQKSRGSVTLF
jgi:hypothetical protein